MEHENKTKKERIESLEKRVAELEEKKYFCKVDKFDFEKFKELLDSSDFSDLDESEIVKGRRHEDDEPKVGDICKFWDYNEDGFVIGELTSVLNAKYPYIITTGAEYQNAKKLTKEQADLYKSIK